MHDFCGWVADGTPMSKDAPLCLMMHKACIIFVVVLTTSNMRGLEVLPQNVS
jgi:hypothetical protein